MGYADWPGHETGSAWPRTPRGEFVDRGPRGYQRSDERVREDICERMARHGDLDASDIEIRVVNGEVTLTGSVPDRHAKRLAEDLAEDVWGVRDVQNQIRVATSSQEPPQRTWPAQRQPRVA